MFFLNPRRTNTLKEVSSLITEIIYENYDKVRKEIRKLNSKTVVNMITAVPDQGIITESIDFGACDYIRKPMDLKNVENAVTPAIKNIII